MLPRLGVGVILFAVLGSCLCQWRTEDSGGLDDFGRPKWNMFGKVMVRPDGLMLHAKYDGTTDHIAKSQGEDITNKMNTVGHFFQMHIQEIQQVLNRFNRHQVNFVSTNGFTYKGANVVNVEVMRQGFGEAIWSLVLADEQGHAGRIMIAFQINRDKWELTHLGPFGVGEWTSYDEAPRMEIERLRQSLQAELNTANTQLENRQYVEAILTQEVQAINRIQGITAGQDDNNNYNVVIDPVRIRDRIGQVQLLQRLYPVDNNVVQRHIDNLRGIAESATRAAAAAARPPRRGWGQVDDAVAHVAAAGEQQGQHQQGQGPPENRRKRRSTNPSVSLNAELKLIDSDPNSEFMISKIELKERYRQGQGTEYKEETHCVDFERNVFVTDPSKTGSKLTAEIEENGTFKPAKVEETPVVRTISIVLKPRGA